jgi:hypothetical protein
MVEHLAPVRSAHSAISSRHSPLFNQARMNVLRAGGVHGDCSSEYAIAATGRMIPKQTVILISGIPATGKSTFARYLAEKHSFAHYDLECHPRGWPVPELRDTWVASRSDFVAQAHKHHDRIALDWGFPVHCLPWVQELQAHGARLIWFDGDVVRARQQFVKRGGIGITHFDEQHFDEQIAAIQDAGYPFSLNCVVVHALSGSGGFLSQREIEKVVFCDA